MKIISCGSLVLAFAALSFPGTVRADVTGHFAINETLRNGPASNLSMDFEVRDNGDFRVSLPIPNAYLLARGEDLYLVATRSGEARAFDFRAVARLLAGDLPGDEDEILARSRQLWSAMELRKTGTLEIGGRSGVSYGLAMKGVEDIANPALFVRASDPRLRLLARPLLALDESEPGWIVFSGMIPMLALPGAQEIFEQGGPLRIVFLDLADVDFDLIADERFELPGEVSPTNEFRAFVLGDADGEFVGESRQVEVD